MYKKKGHLLGSKNPSAKLIEADVLNIRDMYASGFKSRQLAKIFKVCKQTINRIISGRNWGHIKSGIIIHRQGGEYAWNAKFTPGQIRQIRRLKNEGIKSRTIAEIMKTSHSNVNMILAGSRWKHI